MPRTKPKTSLDCTWLPIRSARFRLDNTGFGDETEASARVRVFGWNNRVSVNWVELDVRLGVSRIGDS